METFIGSANRGSISTGYDVENSVKMQTAGTSSEFFNHNISSAGSRTKGTVSMWIKRGDTGLLQYLWEQGNTDNDNGRIFARFLADDTLRVGGGSTVLLNTERVFRDTSAWYHIVVSIDTTSGTANNRVRIYVNGVEETFFNIRNNFSQNDTTGTNFQKQFVGLSGVDESSFQSFNGYMAEVVFQDGVASAPTEFGKFDDDSGIWIPIDASGVTMGTNGSYMKFENASSMGAATAGHAFSVQNINQNDQCTDTPTNNFCTWNPLWVYATQPTISEGATKTVNASSDWTGAKSTIGLTKGKWYWEYKALNNSSLIGIQTDGESNIAASGNAQSKLSTMALFLAGEVEAVDAGGSRDDTNVTFTFNAAHTFGIALDMESSTQTISFYQNGSLITNGGSINIDGLADKTVFPFNAVNNNTVTVNFGGYTANAISSAATDANGYGTFEFAPPTGFYALCSKNLAEYGG